VRYKIKQEGQNRNQKEPKLENKIKWSMQTHPQNPKDKASYNKRRAVSQSIPQIKRYCPTFHYCRSNFKHRGLVWNLVNRSPPQKGNKNIKVMQHLYLNKTLFYFSFHAALSPGQHDC